MSSNRKPTESLKKSAKKAGESADPKDVPTLVPGEEDNEKSFDSDVPTVITPLVEIPPSPDRAKTLADKAVVEKVKRAESGELIGDEMLEELESGDEYEAVSIDEDEYDSLDVASEDVQELGKGKSAPAKSPPNPPPVNVSAKPGTKPSRPRRQTRSWVESVFNEDYLRTLPFMTPQATRLEARFVEESLKLEKGAQVLDLACGYGRHAMELTSQGYNVVGLDNSLPLLLLGADEAQRRGLQINFVHDDMRHMNFEIQFDGAYCLFSSFGFYEDDVNRQILQNASDGLKSGARFVIEVLNRDYLISDLPSRVEWEGDGCKVYEEVNFNYFSSRIVSHRVIIFDDSRKLEQEISIRAFSLHELGKLLHAVGFRVVEISGGLTTRGRFFGAFSRDIVVVAEKR